MTREDAIEKLKAIVPRQDHDGYKIKPSVLVDSLEALGLIKTRSQSDFQRIDAVERLASCLYLKMERMDPNGRGPWLSLSDAEREFYRAGIREILLERTLLQRAIGDFNDPS